jgi:hypothetical protein
VSIHASLQKKYVLLSTSAVNAAWVSSTCIPQTGSLAMVFNEIVSGELINISFPDIYFFYIKENMC